MAPSTAPAWHDGAQGALNAPQGRVRGALCKPTLPAAIAAHPATTTSEGDTTLVLLPLVLAAGVEGAGGGGEGSGGAGGAFMPAFSWLSWLAGRLAAATAAHSVPAGTAAADWVCGR